MKKLIEVIMVIHADAKLVQNTYYFSLITIMMMMIKKTYFPKFSEELGS